MSSTPPKFISQDLEAIQKEMIERYEELTGRKLQPGQPERLLINSFAYRESLLRAGIQSAAQQNLVDFATAPVLDYLADIVGVTRLAASPATVTMEFSKVSGAGSVTVPSGTRIRSNDGEVVFATVEDLNIDAGILTGEVIAEATTNGDAGNEYLPGEIDNILDPMSFITGAVNATESGGGANQEADAPLRERIKKVPDRFSTAGPRGAYEFFAATASPSIIDVSVVSAGSGVVEIYPLVEGGIETPQSILDAVGDITSADDVRPISDTVNVISPVRIEYTLDVAIEIQDGFADNTNQILSDVEDLLQAMAIEKYSGLGRDVTTSEVIQVSRIEGVYSVSVVMTGEAPIGEVVNLSIGDTEFAFSTAINVTEEVA